MVKEIYEKMPVTYTPNLKNQTLSFSFHALTATHVYSTLV